MSQKIERAEKYGDYTLPQEPELVMLAGKNRELAFQALCQRGQLEIGQERPHEGRLRH